MGWVTLTLRKRMLKQQRSDYQYRDLQIARSKRQLARRKQYETALIQQEQKNAIRPIDKDYRTIKSELEAQRSALKKFLTVAQKIASSEAIAGGNGIYLEPNENGMYVKDAKSKNKQFLLDSSEMQARANNGDFGFLKYDELNISKDGKTATYQSLGKTESIPMDEIERFSADTIPAEVQALLPNVSLSGITEDNINSIKNDVDNKLDDINRSLEEASLQRTQDTDAAKTMYEDELAMVEEEANDEELTLDMEQTDIESQLESISAELESIGQAASAEVKQSTIRLA